MDNLTHSLTGALAAKFIESRRTAPGQREKYQRTFFWLFVVAANFPDIDVALAFILDPIRSIQYHRGLTHSILFAPILALVPAVLFLIFGKVKNIRLLWIIALLGILIHIFFDLVTSFGTQILAPLSTTRYAIDWIFIIDPFLAFGLATILLVGKIIPRQRGKLMSGGIGFVVFYVVLTAFNHSVAYEQVKKAAGREQVSWTRISALPQPLSPFSWQGLVQTENGVLQTFFSVLDTGQPRFRVLQSATGELVDEAEQEPEAVWYLRFARHPLVESFDENGQTIVEFRDLMFSIDETLAEPFGFTERSLPFVLRFVYKDGVLIEKQFDGKRVGR